MRLLGYRIKDCTVRVMWNVMNHDSRDIWFSIGGHPAFVSPVEGASIEFDVHKSVTAKTLDENGLVSGETKEFELDGGKLHLSHEMFDNDALIFEDQQIRKAVLKDENDNDVVSMLFDAPLLGVWTPAGKKAPFICIEPWYGRTDSNTFDGELPDREWGNKLKPSEVFSTHYEIIV